MNLRALTARANICLGLLALVTSSSVLAQSVNYNDVVLTCTRFRMTNNLISMDTGYLMKNGDFHFLLDDTAGPQLLGMQESEIEPMLGLPATDEYSYNFSVNAGTMPSIVVRSRASFYVSCFLPLTSSWIILGIKGKTDPNPSFNITSQPESTDCVLGGAASFSCGAYPSSYVSYQWRFKNKDMPGQTSDTLRLSNVTKTDAGIYTCSVSTGGKPAMSKRALLRVLTPVSVKTQPKSQIVHAGATAVFRVTAKGTGPFTYVWYFNVSAISGANKSFLTVPKVTELQAGNYRVLINNGVSSTNSDTVTLTVTP